MAYTNVTENTGIKELRREARRLHLYDFIHNGYEIRVTDRECLAIHKKSLYNAIVQRCVELNTEASMSVITESKAIIEPVTMQVEEKVIEVVEEFTEKVEEVEETTLLPSEITDKETDILEAANKIIRSLDEIVFAELSNVNNTFELALSLPANIIDWIINLADSENPDTILVMRSTLLSKIEKSVSKINDHKEVREKWFTRIRNAVYNSERLSNLAKSRTTRQRGTVQMRTASKMTVDVHKAYDWAFRILKNVGTLKPSAWREVVAALMITTGRRPSEITSSAVFEPSTIDGCVRFYGQLKRHADVIVDGFDIPIIGGKSKEVIDALFWLDINNKRAKPKDRSYESLQEAAKIAHKNYSRYIGIEFKKRYSLIEVISGDWNYKNVKGEDEDRRNPSIFRKFYAQAFADTYHGIGDRDVIISEILGHSDNSSSFKPYDADYQLVKLDESYTRHDKEKFAQSTIARVRARAEAKYALSNEYLKK